MNISLERYRILNIFNISLQVKSIEIGVWCNGSTTDFGSVCPSSSLGTPTIFYLSIISMDAKEIGNTIKRKRKELGWSQSDLAEIAGTTYQTILRMEKGRHTTTESMLAVLKSLNISITIN